MQGFMLLRPMLAHRMVGSMGGAAKEAKKASMKDIHDSWKERWWGAAQLQILSTLDLHKQWAQCVCVCVCVCLSVRAATC